MPRLAKAEAPKGKKGAVVLAIGLPGSGKSSWFKRHNIIPLSSDLVRGLLFDDATEQRFQDLVFSSLRSLLRARLIAGRPMNFIDATNLSPKERHSWIKMAHDFGYEAHAVFFDVPTEVCMERNRKRLRNVPDDVMLRMAQKLRPPKFDEGFAKVIVVRLKSKKGAEAAPAAAEPDSTPQDRHHRTKSAKSRWKPNERGLKPRSFFATKHRRKRSHSIPQTLLRDRQNDTRSADKFARSGAGYETRRMVP